MRTSSRAGERRMSRDEDAQLDAKFPAIRSGPVNICGEHSLKLADCCGFGHSQCEQRRDCDDCHDGGSSSD
jgi:hypothetical protein